VCASAFDWGHTGGDDPDCDNVFIIHNHAAHRVSTVPPPSSSPEGHCFICHTLRLLHGAKTARGARLAPPTSISARALTCPVVPLNGFAVARSSRGPPSIVSA